jgi:hypothetical protein
VLVVEQNFTELSGEIARDYFGKRHEPSLQVGQHGEAVLEGSGAVSSAAPGAVTKYEHFYAMKPSTFEEAKEPLAADA